jgi:hypothetical protein
MNQQPRPLHQIAVDIHLSWLKPYFGAVPYIEAMQTIDSIRDRYYYDTAESIVRYFLANAGTWRGEDAKRIKAELNSQLKTL